MVIAQWLETLIIRENVQYKDDLYLYAGLHTCQSRSCLVMPPIDDAFQRKTTKYLLNSVSYIFWTISGVMIFRSVISYLFIWPCDIEKRVSVLVWEHLGPLQNWATYSAEDVIFACYITSLSPIFPSSRWMDAGSIITHKVCLEFIWGEGISPYFFLIRQNVFILMIQW